MYRDVVSLKLPPLERSDIGVTQLEPFAVLSTFGFEAPMPIRLDARRVVGANGVF
jgi:hypothetical protein